MKNIMILLIACATCSLVAGDDLMPEGGNPNRRTTAEMLKPRPYNNLCVSPKKPGSTQAPVSPNSKATAKEASQKRAAAVSARRLFES